MTMFTRRESGPAHQSRPVYTVAVDVDADALWRSLQGERQRPALVSQGQYGLRHGVPRLLGLLADLRLPATFFVPGSVADSNPSLVKEIHAAGHEIASHGWSHVPLSYLEPGQETDELRRAKEVLEDQSGAPVAGFAAAACDVSDQTLSVLAALGFEYDRSFLDSDWPYLLESDTARLVELPVAWVLDDFSFFGHNLVPRLGWGIRAVAEVQSIWREELAAFRDFGGYGCLVLHPQIIGRRPRISMLGDLLAEVQGWGPVQTCRDVARSVAEST